MQPRYYLLCGIVKAGLLNIKFYYAILLEIQQLKKNAAAVRVNWYCASTLHITVSRLDKQRHSPVLARNSDVSAPLRCSDARRLGERGAKVCSRVKRQEADNNSCDRMKQTKDTLALLRLTR